MYTIPSLFSRSQDPVVAPQHGKAETSKASQKGDLETPPLTAREAKVAVLGGLSLFALSGLALNRINRTVRADERNRERYAKLERIYSQLPSRVNVLKVVSALAALAAVVYSAYKLSNSI